MGRMDKEKLKRTTESPMVPINEEHEIEEMVESYAVPKLELVSPFKAKLDKIKKAKVKPVIQTIDMFFLG